MHRGNLEIRCVCAWHEFSEKQTWLRKEFHRMIFRRMGLGDGPTNEDHDCFGKFSNTFASEGSLIFLPTRSIVHFQEQQFCFENDVFLIHGLGKCEGVGEDSRHGNEHVDIQVGSRIYLSACLNWSIAYALRWRVTHLG